MYTKKIGANEVSPRTVSEIIKNHPEGTNIQGILRDFFDEDQNPSMDIYEETERAIRHIIRKLLSPEENGKPFGVRYDGSKKLWYPLAKAVVITPDSSATDAMMHQTAASIPDFLKGREPVQGQIIFPRDYAQVLRVQYLYHGGTNWDDRPIWSNFILFISRDRMRHHPRQSTSENVKLVKITFQIGDRIDSEEIKVPEKPARHFVIMSPMNID